MCSRGNLHFTFTVHFYMMPAGTAPGTLPSCLQHRDRCREMLEKSVVLKEQGGLLRGLGMMRNDAGCTKLSDARVCTFRSQAAGKFEVKIHLRAQLPSSKCRQSVCIFLRVIVLLQTDKTSWLKLAWPHPSTHAHTLYKEVYLKSVMDLVFLCNRCVTEQSWKNPLNERDKHPCLC